ncbi:uncharacterized protein LOC133531396 [Cydia pomonella]|uniref:uncharacterized protein LOC133531396 n=1 Tax=Cydia pomonella TaxID=82600 RepID=UPI002ADD6139|nr:uncharacterized protein LOC133531396 [Cydia pomonella]
MVVLLTLFFIKTCACVTMPVILIDPQTVLNPDISNNPFDVMSSENFASIALDAIHKGDSVLIFVEEKFSVEDIASKDKLGNPYSYIHKNFLEDKAKYMPRVVEPFKTLQRILPLKRDNVMNTATMNFDDRYKYHYIHFEEGKDKETRVQTLRRHDDYIKNAFMYCRSKHKGMFFEFFKQYPYKHPHILSYYGHVTRREDDAMERLVVQGRVDGTRPRLRLTK